MTWDGAPSDYYKKLTITGQLNQACQGNVVTNTAGEEVGVYLDDSMPRLDYYIKQALLNQEKIGHIWVAVPMIKWHLRYAAPIINLQEWYTFQSGIPSFELPHQMPKCKGYILQDKYPGYLWDDAPHMRSTLKQPPPKVLEDLVHEALENHPEFIFTF